MRQLGATRYVTPLREGGSLPAIIEADDGALYVVKFRGAGQGSRALIADLIGGALAQSAGLPVPALALIDVDDGLARTEADPEIRELLLASVGTNLAMAYLDSALSFDPAAQPQVPGTLASDVVTFDAFAMNVDRTAKNPNLLWWRGDLWLIDHGAAFYWHHGWGQQGTDRDIAAMGSPFARIADHVLLPWADRLSASGEALLRHLTDAVIAAVVDDVPASWFGLPDAPARAQDIPAIRAAYVAHLRARRDATPVFVEEAIRARAKRI